MATDLPTAVRQALHAHEITASDLRQPVLRARARQVRRPSRAFAATASAALIVALAVLVSVTAFNRHDGPHRSAGAAEALVGVIGYRWDLARVRDPHGEISLPSALHAEIGFTRDGYVLGDDTVNAMQGNYESTPGGYSVRNGGGTLAGSTGGDPVRRRVTSAVDDMFVTFTDSPGTTAPPVIIAARLDGTVLTLRRNSTTLTLTRSGTQPDFLTPTPSPTSTAPGATPFSLYTHCGINETRIGSTYYVADTPLSDGNGNPPSGWGNPYQVGTITLPSPSVAIFRDNHGHTVTFHARPGATSFLHICS